jgi:nucleoside-diphosphate-sugar epimerase
MNILITGASGNVGSGAAELLAAKHKIRLSDVGDLQTSLSFYKADIRNKGALDAASEGMDVLIHTPAYHGIHTSTNSEQDFYDLNVTGTFQMFQSAVRNHIRRVVWLSSMSVYGSDFYAYTKKIGEQLCQFYHENHGLEIIMLRPTDFTPFRDFRHYGERMLHGGVDRRDVIAAVEQAVDCNTSFGAYQIVREDPFTADDVQAYSKSPIEVLERIYPGAKAIIESYQYTIPSQIHQTDLTREKAEINYHPKYNFGTFIKECTKQGVIQDKVS